MRVVQVCPYDWEAPGGVQTHVRSLARELTRRGHTLLVLAPGRTISHEPGVAVIGPVIRVPFNGTIAPICPSPLAGWHVRRTLRHFAPDLVHVHEPLAPSLSAYATFSAPAPIVATLHANCDSRLGPWIYARGTSLLNRRVAAGIAVSPSAMRCLGPNVRVPFAIVPNGVDLPPADVARRLPRPSRRLLFAHRLEPRKGFRTALAAFARLARHWPALELVVIGEGPERHAVDVLEPDLRTRLHLHNVVSRSTLAAELDRADLFLAPALHGESFGISILEALARGVPVVASDIDGYREILRDEGGGVLVRPNDPEALSAAVASLLHSPDRHARLASAGRRRAEEYSWRQIGTSIEEVYQRAIGRAPGREPTCAAASCDRIG